MCTVRHKTLAAQQHSKFTSTFGGIAEMAGLPAGSTRSRKIHLRHCQQFFHQPQRTSGPRLNVLVCPLRWSTLGERIRGVKMNRRNFIALVGGAAGYTFLRPDIARTETIGPKPRIGMLWHAGSARGEVCTSRRIPAGTCRFWLCRGTKHRSGASLPCRKTRAVSEAWRYC